MNDNRSILSSHIFTDIKCDDLPKPIQRKYLESMFYAPLNVPEQAKVIQSTTAESGGR